MTLTPLTMSKWKAPIPKLIDNIDVLGTRTEKVNALFNILNGFEEYTLNSDGIIISSNLEAVNVTGYEEWEVIGKHISILYTDDDVRSGLPQQNLDSAREKQVVFLDWKLTRKKGRFLSKTKIIPFKNHLQVTVGFKVILRNVTHKAAYSEKVGRIKKEYNHLYKSASIGIIRFSIGDTQIIDLNKRASSIFHDVGPSQFFRDQFADHNVYAEFDALLKTTNYVQNFEFLSVNKVWVSMDVTVFPAEGYFEGIVFDVTYQKGQLDTIEKLKLELDTLIYQTSHHLRSPLTTLFGLINVLKIDPERHLAATYVKMIEERVVHLDVLLRNLSALSYNNSTAVEPEEIDLREHVHCVFEELKKEPITLTCTSRSHSMFKTDPIRFRLIIKHLVENAVRFRNKQGESVLHIHIDITGLNATVTVTDNGVGIEDNVLMHIYEMFYRGTQVSDGAGLGLAIVKSVIEKLNGQITVASRPGKSTTFVIVLPML